jgi:hypothetical protein
VSSAIELEKNIIVIIDESVAKTATGFVFSIVANNKGELADFEHSKSILVVKIDAQSR